jgi:hypothetical protein
MIARVAFWIAAVALTSCQKPSALPISGHSSEVAKEATEQSPLFFEKTACFGRCPVFVFQGDGNQHFSLKITQPFYKGNLARFEPGQYNATLSPNESKRFNERVLAAAEAVRFSTLERVYDNPMVTDLPSTILEIQGHRVANRYGGPNLNTLYAEIETLIDSFQWRIQE